MEEENIIIITTTFKAIGIGFTIQPEWKTATLYLLFMSITVNFIPKTSTNKWIDYQYN